MITTWKITWLDGADLRETKVMCGPYDILNQASMQLVNTYMILKIERVPNA